MRPTRLFNSISNSASYLPTGVMVPVMGMSSYVAASQMISGVPTAGSAALCAVAVATCATLLKAEHTKQSRLSQPK